MFTLADGTLVPPEMLKQLVLDEWKAAHNIKLHPGDCIGLNNRSFQHDSRTALRRNMYKRESVPFPKEYVTSYYSRCLCRMVVYTRRVCSKVSLSTYIFL